MPYCVLGGRKRSMDLGRCSVMEIFWVVGMERNKGCLGKLGVRRWIGYGIGVDFGPHFLCSLEIVLARPFLKLGERLCFSFSKYFCFTVEYYSLSCKSVCLLVQWIPVLCFVFSLFVRKSCFSWKNYPIPQSLHSTTLWFSKICFFLSIHVNHITAKTVHLRSIL